MLNITYINKWRAHKDKSLKICHKFCCQKNKHTHTFNGPLSGTTWVSQYRKDKTNLDFTEARDSEWQWHQLGHMQVCTSLQTDNHTSTPPLSFFIGWMPFLPPKQQRQSTEGRKKCQKWTFTKKHKLLGRMYRTDTSLKIETVLPKMLLVLLMLHSAFGSVANCALCWILQNSAYSQASLVSGFHSKQWVKFHFWVQDV